MKYGYLLLVSLIYSQEFRSQTNGLLYSNKTLAHLKNKVDSIHRLELTKLKLNRFKSLKQSMCVEISATKNVDDILETIKQKPSFDELIQKHPEISFSEPALYLKIKQDSLLIYEKFRIDDYGQTLEYNFNVDKYSDNEKQSWIYSGVDSENKLKAVYSLDGFKSDTLPEKYQSMIGYTHAMIDTTQSIFFDQAIEVVSDTQLDDDNPISNYLAFVNQHTQKPEFSYDGDFTSDLEKNDKIQDWKIYSEEFQKWDSLRFETIKKDLINTDTYKELYQNAVIFATETKQGNSEFEDYVCEFGNKKDALLLKRSRIVYGQCSQDLSPRIHALNIAKLAAETGAWEIFLRAHLNILNDNFPRMSDGSYAYGQRFTYIKELETINLDVEKLLFGIALRVQNVPKNHYYGTLYRIGRSFTEISNPAQFESHVLEMIQDKNLDYFNRMLMMGVYISFVFRLDDERLFKEKSDQIIAIVDTFPSSLKRQVLNVINN